MGAWCCQAPYSGCGGDNARRMRLAFKPSWGPDPHICFPHLILRSQMSESSVLGPVWGGIYSLSASHLSFLLLVTTTDFLSFLLSAYGLGGQRALTAGGRIATWPKPDHRSVPSFPGSCDSSPPELKAVMMSASEFLLAGKWRKLSPLVFFHPKLWDLSFCCLCHSVSFTLGFPT